MTWSLNELEAETRKAIRGAGLSWGLSEDGGKAVRWLAAHGVDPLPALRDVLDRHDRGAIAATFPLTDAGAWHADAPICPITLGVTLCDCADRLAAHACVAGPVARPLLLAPFMATAARILGRHLILDVSGMQVVLNERGDPSGDLLALDMPDAAKIRCAVVVGRVPLLQVKSASTRGIATDPQAWGNSLSMSIAPMCPRASARAAKARAQD
jgi:hypothetical protein